MSIAPTVFAPIPPVLEAFIAATTRQLCASADPAEHVIALAPAMLDLIDHPGALLGAGPMTDDAWGHARRLVYEASDAGFSLYAHMWRPGQWTLVPDPGSWGIVGVVDGVLEERRYVRNAAQRGAGGLVRGGSALMRRGSVSGLVPGADRIHVVGVPAARARAMSLHLYGCLAPDARTDARPRPAVASERA